MYILTRLSQCLVTDARKPEARRWPIEESSMTVGAQYEYLDHIFQSALLGCCVEQRGLDQYRERIYKMDRTRYAITYMPSQQEMTPCND